MLPFVRFVSRKTRLAGSHLAMAAAMAGAAVVVGAAPAPAYAKEKPAKANYSPAFIAAYKPVNDAFNAKGHDIEAVKADVPKVAAAAQTDDDRFAAGQLIYNVGGAAKDNALQLQGVTLMIQSGKVPPEAVGQYNFIAGQLAFQQKDYDGARKYMQASLDANFTEADPGVIIAESDFAQNKNAEGMQALSQAIARRRAAGQAIDPNWYNRGFVIAYNAQLGPQAMEYAADLVSVQPTETNWANAVGVARMFGKYDDQGVLDLMRLARRVNALRNQRDYVDYISAADARRLPAEVNEVIAQGVASGALKTGDVFVTEAKNVAAARLPQDKNELVALEKDARAPNSNATTAMGSGDAYLSWNNTAKAEELYKIALTRPGVDTDRVLTRLGIAQADQGKWADAKQTFAKISGPRKAIARLWLVYVDQRSGAGAQAAAAVPAN